MPKTAIVDIDNTLWQFCDAFYEELAKINRSFPTPDNWTNWDIWEGYCSKEDFYGAVNAVHSRQDSDNYLPYSESKDFLLSLKEQGYHIIIASHRSPDYRVQTENWLNRHGLVFNELHLSFNKTRIINLSTDVVVDDAPEVLEKAVEYGAKATGLLFPWNREYLNNGFKLYDSLKEILNHILYS
ncbi:MAG: hypothetical protein HQL08_12835 [Nitrospirae bacterium]|nr:hypothetical protein [Nitrospirota bacterium]